MSFLQILRFTFYIGTSKGKQRNSEFDFSFGNFIKNSSSYLEGPIISRSFTGDALSCWMRCLDVLECLSVNVGAIADSSLKFWCELLSVDKYSCQDEKYQPNSTSDHYEIKSACEHKPCKNGTCHTSKHDDTYTCVCDDGFIGENCDIIKEARALGMEDGRIKDDQITQSSYYDYMSMGKHARLNILVGLGAWMAQGFASGERIQIDLNRLVIVTKVATQGRYGLDRWITSFTISYSLDGTNWKVYQEGGVEKVFQVVGVTNRHQVVDTVLPLPIKTKLLRITTVTCKGYCALRMEVYGYDAD
ncbi:EGF-like repeat and discoidin I-like domain-containing protein 3 isoform X3 [Nematostella vectensis]|uniref:EGF-like repeat and discoidin I-like domain-containing protein 3 isoform X3 n=1 Tax=Nematostella vectensis TaxID=45351 RepID=UPI0020776655|nr:EGF-like repeat and discoidin I-like domain-containing protein 3 isoform X3 [Nematostella vectensis]